MEKRQGDQQLKAGPPYISPPRLPRTSTSERSQLVLINFLQIACHPFVGMVSAALFIVSAMPTPVPTAGTCSHPAGTGLAAILIGPFATVVATSVALLIQALFLARGGIITWGANIFSMGIIGAFSGYLIFKALVKFKLPLTLAAFLAGLVSDWATYTATSLELALGLSGKAQFLGYLKRYWLHLFRHSFPYPPLVLTSELTGGCSTPLI